MKSYKDMANFSNWSKEEKDQYTISVMKGLVMDATRQANSGHPGGPMSCADFAYLLYRYHLNFDPKDPEWFDRDRFILSGGHIIKFSDNSSKDCFRGSGSIKPLLTFP